MPLVTTKKILSKADKENYAVGAFNFTNMETLQAVISAARELNSPVIVQSSESTIKYMSLDYITAMVTSAAKNENIPIALHLDHGSTVEMTKDCIKAGYTSVMIDGSALKLEENITLTKKVVDLAKLSKVSVEAELGKLGIISDFIMSTADASMFLTNPEEAKRFVKETKVDALAIAIGTAHGPFKNKPKLAFDLIEEIKALLKMPLVMHGASGVPDQDIKRAVEAGINKININTDIRQAFSASIKNTFARKPDTYKIRAYLDPARTAAEDVVKRKIELFGSAGKA
ncbi:MAG: class II fructose-1,6-bisphosphate aldolase [DPANN group archaeon]|nr:class II fructose-1,6-bisphosphate aldolase [DPANN group archaeon]